MFRFTTIVLALLLFSCSKHKTKRTIGIYQVESNFINDTIFDGRTNYIDSMGRLEKIEHYSNGIPNGVFLILHSNGKTYDSVNYVNGFKNGFHHIYDSTGVLSYVDHFFMGRPIGPVIYYTNGLATHYYFNSFEQQNIYTAEFDSIGNRTKLLGDHLNCFKYSNYVGDDLVDYVFAFFVRPPKIAVTYQLVKRDSITNSEMVLRDFKNEVFVDTEYAERSDKSKYFIKADVFDSIQDKRQLYYAELNWK